MRTRLHRLACLALFLCLVQGIAMAQSPGAGPDAGRGAPGGRRGGAAAQSAASEDGKFTVTVQRPTNGSVKVSPDLPADGRVAAGTVLTVTASPAEGYVLDSCFYSAGRGSNNEFPTAEVKLTVNRNMTVGASFIEESAVERINVINNVVYAKPGAKELKYDVFSPKGAKNLPCVVIIHGGGWTSNCEDVMRGLARELSKDGKYVAVSIDYRWIGTGDGDAKPNKMADLIDDCYGAIVHIQEHAAEYGVDPTRLAVTGDSAGGHLSAAVINMTTMIGEGGFGVKEGVYEYKPTYMPQGKTVQQVRDELTKAIRVAAPSYGVFAGTSLRRFASAEGPDALKAIAPIDHIPDVKERAVPQFLTRGTNDPLISNEVVQAYADALKAKGQTAEYVQLEGASHAFFDWKPDARTKATFMRYGVPYAARMEEFFNKVFYP